MSEKADVLGQWLTRQRRALGQAAGFSLVIGVIGLAGAAFMFEVYGRVLNSGNSRTLLMLLLAVLGAHALAGALENIRSHILRAVAWDFDQTMAPFAFQRLAGPDLASPVPMSGPQLMADCRTVRGFIHSGNITALLDLPAAILFLAGVWLIHPWLGWIAVVAAGLQVLTVMHVERRTHPLLRDAFQQAGRAREQFRQAVSSRNWIVAMGMHRRIRERWLSQQAQYLRHHTAASLAHSDDIAATKSLAPVLNALLLGVGCWLVVTGTLGEGGGLMLVASILGGKVLAPLMQLTLGWRTVIEARAAFRRIRSVINATRAEVVPMPLPAPSGRLSVERLDVVPAANKPAVVRGIQFALAPGEVLLVLGASGAGKSSLLRTLAGVTPPAAGKIRLDGAEIGFWDPERLGSWLGYQPQDSQLLQGMIGENITRFQPPDASRLAAALAAAGLADWAEDGSTMLQMSIESGGAPLSGGERQRVALARACYGDVRVLILDEPNAHLDEAGERNLLAMLRQCKKSGVTTVLTSHRPGVMPAVDKILAIQNGRQLAFGNKDEVRRTLEAARTAENPRSVPALPATASPGGTL